MIAPCLDGPDTLGYALIASRTSPHGNGKYPFLFVLEGCTVLSRTEFWEASAPLSSGEVPDLNLEPSRLEWFSTALTRWCEPSNLVVSAPCELRPLTRLFVGLHFVLVTNRFNFRSMRKQRLLVIVINLNNESSLCFLLRGLIIGVFSFCGLAKKC